MRSQVRTVFINRIKDDLYPFSIEILDLCTPIKKIIGSWTARNILFSTYEDKIINKYGLIGARDSEHSYLSLSRKVVKYV